MLLSQVDNNTIIQAHRVHIGLCHSPRNLRSYLLVDLEKKPLKICPTVSLLTNPWSFGILSTFNTSYTYLEMPPKITSLKS